MKKIAIIFLLLMVVFALPNIFAEEDTGNSGRIKDRNFEIGLADIDINLSNNFLSSKDIFTEHMVIDLDNLKDGFKFDFNLGISPIYFKYSSNDKWGFGLDVGVDAYGTIDMAGDMLTFQETEDAESEIAAAVFADVSVPIFFRLPIPILEKIKLKVRPSVYYPVLYTQSSMSYTYMAETENRLNIEADARIYTAFSLDQEAAFNLSATPGFDIALGAEFALSEALGINKIPLLDFDVGIDISGIPIITSSMKDYMDATVGIGQDEPIDILDIDDTDGLFELENPSYGTKKISVVRPFKALAWANWRPFGGSKILTFTPTVGFSVNELYKETTAFEGGLKVRLDLANIFILTAGVGYNDHLWKNSLDLALNLRAFELDVGASLEGQTFKSSWVDSSGLGIKFGLKFGW